MRNSSSTGSAVGDVLPAGVVAHSGLESNDLVLWLPSVRALILGDALVDRGPGLEIPTTWASPEITVERRAV